MAQKSTVSGSCVHPVAKKKPGKGAVSSPGFKEALIKTQSNA
jgi:hypothetical protein